MASITATRVTCPISLLVTISLTLRYYVHAIKLRRLSNHKHDICNFGTMLWLAIYHSDYDAWKRFTHIFCIHCIHDDLIKSYHIMTSSNGNIFRVTGPLCGEFTGPGEFPTQRPVTRSFDVFFDLRLNKRLSKQPWGWWFETSSWSLWRQCNDTIYESWSMETCNT